MLIVFGGAHGTVSAAARGIAAREPRALVPSILNCGDVGLPYETIVIRGRRSCPKLVTIITGHLKHVNARDSAELSLPERLIERLPFLTSTYADGAVVSGTCVGEVVFGG